MAAFRKAETWGTFRKDAPDLYKWALQLLKEEAEHDHEWLPPSEALDLSRNTKVPYRGVAIDEVAFHFTTTY